MKRSVDLFENFILSSSMELHVRINDIWIHVKEVVVLVNRVCFVKEDDSYIEIDLKIEANMTLWEEYNSVLKTTQNIANM